MNNAELILKIINAHPYGLWIRAIARKANISPSTVCNHIYGYMDSKGNWRRSQIADKIRIEKFGQDSVTIIKPRL